MNLEERLEALEARLNALETFLDLPRRTSEPETQAEVPPPAPPPIEPQPPRPAAFVRQPARSGNWLGIIAVICFVLAAAFIVKLSIESGWLTPARQIGLAALLGVTLIGAGLALRRADRAYASLLPGAGVVILYLAAFTAHSVYKLIAFDSALVVTTLVSALCVWLYAQIRHDLYAFIAATGAYLAPVILGLPGDL